MKHKRIFFSALVLLTLMTMVFASPAQAFDGRSGEKIVIEPGEIIDDDLYVTANEFTFEGTVKGDLVVFGTTILVNGTVEGDLIAAGQSVVINGAAAGKTGKEVLAYAETKCIILRSESKKYGSDGWFRVTIGSKEENQLFVDTMLEFFGVKK